MDGGTPVEYRSDGCPRTLLVRNPLLELVSRVFLIQGFDFMVPLSGEGFIGRSYSSSDVEASPGTLQCGAMECRFPLTAHRGAALSMDSEENANSLGGAAGGPLRAPGMHDILRVG